MPTTFAQDQVTRLETLLAQNTGVESVTVDGQSVKYSDLLKQYEFWKSRAARESGARPVAYNVNLGSF